MQLVFKSLRWKNFLSTGNVWTTIQLQKNTDTLIIGENGAGKSTFIDALTFACYGKPFRDIGKPGLLNSINDKDCVVEIEITSGGIDYTIIRGIKPNMFEIYQSGVLVKQEAAAKDYQAWLESHVLKMNFKAFSQIVVLGSDSYIPFMRLKQARRREVIEEILDIRIFSSMNAVLKKRVQLNREHLETNRISTTVLDERYATINKHVGEIETDKEVRRQSYQTELTESETQIKDTEAVIVAYKTDITTLEGNISDYAQVDKTREKYSSLRDQILNKQVRLEGIISFLNKNDECPTCEQTIEEQFKTNEVHKHIKIVAECTDALITLYKKIEEYNLKLSAMEKIKTDIGIKKTSVSKFETKILGLKDYIKKITKSLNDLDLVKPVAIKTATTLEEVDAERDIVKTARNELIETRKYLDFGLSLLRDDGVKTREIRRYLPLINTLVNKHLNDMDSYVNFTLNENFEEIIKSRHRDKFIYNSFSAGERLRIDLALLFTWREVAARKNSVHTNLLIMDEVFDSSLDSQGTEEFLKLINTLTGTNVFVISHRNEFLFDKFKAVIKFVKLRNFSQIE